MKDGLNQELKVGDRVVWLAGLGKYGGVTIYVVRWMTAKRVAIATVDHDPEQTPSFVKPNVLVVINQLLDSRD